MSRKVVEKAVVIGALSIFEALELDLSRLLFFGLVDFLSGFRNVKRVDRIESEELQSPNDIGSVLNVARLLETLEGDGLRVVRPVERANDDKGSIGVTLEFL